MRKLPGEGQVNGGGELQFSLVWPTLALGTTLPRGKERGAVGGEGLQGSYAVITSGDSTGTGAGAGGAAGAGARAGGRGGERGKRRGRGGSAGVPGPQWRQDLRGDDVSRGLGGRRQLLEDDRPADWFHRHRGMAWGGV